MRIAVAGGTGVVGRHVVDEARERGYDVRVLARSEGVDLRSPEGLADHLSGCDAVVDVTSTTLQRRAAAEGFFGDITRNLLAAEKTAGVSHHLVLSIVGVDVAGAGYYEAKRLQERLVAEGPVPWTILRATQFHEFAEQALEILRVGSVSVVPRMLTQPIAAREVGAALVDLLEAGPSGRVPDLAGPEKLQMVELARRVVRQRGLRRVVMPLRVPGAGGRAMRQGRLTPYTVGPRGTTTFDEWLVS